MAGAGETVEKEEAWSARVAGLPIEDLHAIHHNRAVAKIHRFIIAWRVDQKATAPRWSHDGHQPAAAQSTAAALK